MDVNRWTLSDVAHVMSRDVVFRLLPYFYRQVSKCCRSVWKVGMPRLSFHIWPKICISIGPLTCSRHPLGVQELRCFSNFSVALCTSVLLLISHFITQWIPSLNLALQIATCRLSAQVLLQKAMPLIPTKWTRLACFSSQCRCCLSLTSSVCHTLSGDSESKLTRFLSFVPPQSRSGASYNSTHSVWECFFLHLRFCSAVLVPSYIRYSVLKGDVK